MEFLPTMGQPRDISPEDAIIEEVSRAAGQVSFLVEQMAAAEELMNDRSLLTEERTSAVIQANSLRVILMQERQHLVKVSQVAISVGIAERQIRLAERQGQLLATVMFGVISASELGLSPQQVATAKKLVRRRIEALASSSADLREQQEDAIIEVGLAPPREEHRPYDEGEIVEFTEDEDYAG